MAKNVNHVSHIKSTSSAITSGNSVFIADGKAGPKLPVASTLIQGEIAVNLAKDVETLSIVNTSGEIVTFSSDKIIKKVIVDNEQVTSAALNDLNNRKLDASAYTQPDLSAYATEEWVSDRLGSGFTGDNSGISVTQTIEENGLVVAAALNDLNNRKLDASAYTPADLSDYYTKPETDELLSAKADTTLVEEKLGSGFTGDNSGNTVTKVIEENELVVAAALNDLETKKLDASAYTPADLSDLYILSGEVKDNALVVAASLNDLNSRKLDASAYTQVEIDTVLDSGSTNPVANSAITTTILENEEVVAEALADLDSRISGNTTYITQVNAKADTIARSLSGYTPSGYSYSKSEVEAKLNNKLDASAYTQTSIVELDNSTEYASGDVPTALSVRQAIVDNELVVASALNDLEERKLDASAFTETSAALETLSGEVASKELVVSAALNDLNTRLIEVSGDVEDHTSAISELYERINTLDPEVVKVVTGLPSIGSSDISTGKIYLVKNDSSTESGTSGNVYTEYVYVSGQTGGNRWEKIGEWKPEISVDAALSSSSTNPVQNKVVKSAIDNKQDKLTAGSGITIDSANTISVKIDTNSDEWTSGSTGVPATSALAEVLEEIEEVTATALNDLNDRLLEVSGSQLTASSFKTINGQTIVGSGNISIEGSGGGQANVIETVKVNGNALTPDANKAVDITSVPASIVSQDATHRFVSDTEKSTWNSKQNAFSNASTLSGISATNVTNWNSVTAKTDTTAFTAHTGDTTVHVTAAEKNTWNGKQDALSNTSVLTGISSTNVTNWNNAATSAHSHSNKSVLDNLTQSVIDNSHTHSNKTTLDGITTAKTAQWDTVTAKTDNTAFTAHTANTTVHVTSAEKSTWNGKQDAISDLASIRTSAATQSDWNATSGVGQILNKPTIPTSLSQLDSAHTHSEYATTGTVNTLNNTVTAHTANTTAHITAAERTTWNGKQDSISDLASIRTSAATQSDWNATSGVAMIKNKPTIPAAPGTLTTTATTAQSTATNEALSGNIALHKVSKTGSYNDLNDKPTIANNYVTGGRVNKSNGVITLTKNDGTTASVTGLNTYVGNQIEIAKTATGGYDDSYVNVSGDTMTGALTISADTANTLNVIGGSAAMVDTKPVLNVGTTYHQTILKIFDDGTPHAQINGTLEVSTSDGFAIKSTVNSSGHTGFQTNGKIISSAFQVSGHTNQNLNELLLANGRILVLPTFSSADNGKILGIQNGQLAWIKPTTIYTGSGTPSSSQGNNGDIYLQTS